jgi:hypothetical protein
MGHITTGQKISGFLMAGLSVLGLGASGVMLVHAFPKPVPITGPDAPLQEHYTVTKIFLTGSDSVIVLRPERGALIPVDITAVDEPGLEIIPDVAAEASDWVQVQRARVPSWMDQPITTPGMYATYIQQIVLHVHNANDINPGATPDVLPTKGNPGRPAHLLQDLP